MRSFQESFALLLNPVSLSESDKRYRERFFRILLYSDGLVLVLVTLAFRRQWLIIFVIWFIVTAVLMGLFVRKVQNVARDKGAVPNPEKQSFARRELSKRLRRPIILFALSGVLLLFTGMYNAVGYVFAGFVLLFSLVLFLLARRIR